MINFLKKNYLNLLLILIFIIGMTVLLYPNISDYVNQLNSSRAVSEYNTKLESMDVDTKAAFMKAAKAYNKKLLTISNRFKQLSEEDKREYMSILDIDGNGMICYLKIDKLKVNLPVYHTTEEKVLREFTGHVEGSSFPVGGYATHAVLSGHRGLPNAVLFTNLDKMEVGDRFSIFVLGEELLYEVDNISTVLPDEVEGLSIEADKDWVTLVTCTPYGVNTHRLLVRGTRIEKEEEAVAIMENPSVHQAGITREEVTIYIAIGMMVIFLIILIIMAIINGKRRKRAEAVILGTPEETLEMIDEAAYYSGQLQLDEAEEDEELW